MNSTTLSSSARKWTITGGLFNCIAAFPLAMPFLHEWYIDLFNNVNLFFNLGGSSWKPPTDGGNMLFLNTAGLALFLVGITLLYASKNINHRIEIPLFNGLIRFVWGLIAIYYILAFNLIHLMFSIVIIDFVLAIAYVYYYVQIKRFQKIKASLL